MTGIKRVAVLQFKKRLSMNTALLLCSLVFAAPVFAGDVDPDESVRTTMYASDYHVEARLGLKTIRTARERINRMQDQSRSRKLVVLTDSLSKNLKSLDGLSEIGEKLYSELGSFVPKTDTVATDLQKENGERVLREIKVIKDRAMAIYVSSKSFFKKLTRKTETTIVRMDRED